MSKPVCVWDITIPTKDIDKYSLMDKFKEHCKKWIFSMEKGEKTGYEHFQCRISLKLKKRLNGVIDLFQVKSAHFSITSGLNHENDFYIVKEETRIGGPWSDKDPYIPKQIRDIKNLYPWQWDIICDADKWDTRTINVIIDLDGNIGKSTLATYIAVKKIGRQIPPFNDFRDIMRVVMNTAKERLYLIDIPRALPKKHLSCLYAGIERIKDGYAFDDRYSFKDEHFDCPNVWVFTNEEPNKSWLTKDRWKLWAIVDKKLKPYK